LENDTPWPCSLCGETFMRLAGAKGQAKSWCKPCRRDYMREYMRLNEWKYIGRTHGPPKPPLIGPPKPSRIIVGCYICGQPARMTLCGSEACSVEASRRKARERRMLKPASHIAAKRQSDRTRRMRKRNNLVVKYNHLDIAERDRWRCSLCGKRIDAKARHPEPLALTMDHIIPVSQGGDDAPYNVRACHSVCNSRKGNRVHGDGEQLMLVG